MHIGELAARLGLNPRTIRYYERIGLLLEPERSDAGYRLYGADAAERLHFILKAKTIGLSLEEIGEILSLRDEDQRPCERVLGAVDDKITAIDAQLRTLSELRAELVTLRTRPRRRGAKAALFAASSRHTRLPTSTLDLPLEWKAYPRGSSPKRANLTEGE